MLDEVEAYADRLKVVLAYLANSGDASASRVQSTSRRTSRTDSISVLLAVETNDGVWISMYDLKTSSSQRQQETKAKTTKE